MTAALGAASATIFGAREKIHFISRIELPHITLHDVSPDDDDDEDPPPAGVPTTPGHPDKAPPLPPNQPLPPPVIDPPPEPDPRGPYTV
jgi:hypothetical protein